jgi:hypothetical protein
MFCVEDAVPGLGRHFLFEGFENNSDKNHSSKIQTYLTFGP